MNSLFLRLSLLSLLLGGRPGVGSAGSTEEAHLRFDFSAPMVEVELNGDSESIALGADDLLERLREFRGLLSSGADEDEIHAFATELGEQLLGGLPASLRDCSSWRVTPLSAAPLSALIAPWSGEPVLVGNIVSYDIEGPRRTPDLEIQRAGEGLLAMVPFTPGLDPDLDDHDPLMDPLRTRIKRIDTIPRNSTNIDNIGGAFSEHHYGLVLLRTRPHEASRLLSVLAGGPPLLWWTRPPLEAQSETYAGDLAARIETRALVEKWTSTGRSMVVDLWPRDDDAMGTGGARFVDFIQAGEIPAEALRSARLALHRLDQSRFDDWAGWIYVGDPQAEVRIAKAGWLQRWLRGRR